LEWQAVFFLKGKGR